nr:protein kinase-like domain, phloem protein 2-like protein [Tanacetum cinerariifolium]
VEDKTLEDSNSDSDSDTYWEQKIPNDYEEILKLSKDRVRWTTKKELYSIFCRGLLLDKGQQWFTIDKNGKKCQMLCARASLVSDKRNSTWESLPQSRFGEVLVITADDKFKIWRRIASQDVSSETRYACYLVYRLPLDQSTFEAPLHVNINNGHAQDAWFVYLSPPNSPVIGQNLDENSWNPLNRFKGNGIPKQRGDGWMEVKVWEFQTQDTRKTTHIHLKLTHLDKKDLSGLMVQGIELRPI